MDFMHMSYTYVRYVSKRFQTCMGYNSDMWSYFPMIMYLSAHHIAKPLNTVINLVIKDCLVYDSNELYIFGNLTLTAIFIQNDQWSIQVIFCQHIFVLVISSALESPKSLQPGKPLLRSSSLTLCLVSRASPSGLAIKRRVQKYLFNKNLILICIALKRVQTWTLNLKKFHLWWVGGWYTYLDTSRFQMVRNLPWRE